MISGRQSRAARALLALSQADLSRLSRVSIPRITAFENNSDCLVSTATAIRTALENAGARFDLRDGSVRVVPKSECFIIEPRQDPDAETVRAAQAILAAAAKARSPTGGLG